MLGEGGRYWEGQEKGSCRLCGGESETWGQCVGGMQTVEQGGRKLAGGSEVGEKGQGKDWMREIEKERKVPIAMETARVRVRAGRCVRE